jgi:predicted acylesterase/phospholipase RssA/CRP-like cAMP-binding protein
MDVEPDHAVDDESSAEIVRAAASASPLLQRMSVELRSSFLARLKTEQVASGATLMLAEETGDALYLIVSGRLRVLSRESGGAAIAELGRGDTVGEASLMTGERRSASVVALRDSLVARLDRDRFRELIEAFPLEMMAVFAGQMAQRSREAASRTGRSDRPPASMALLALTAGVEVETFSRRFAGELKTFGEVLAVSSATPAVRAAQPGSDGGLVAWLNDQESSYRQVLYEADHDDSRWTQRCVRQADRVYLIAEAQADPTVVAAHMFDLIPQHAAANSGKEFDLVLLHAGGDAMPQGTATWRAAFPGVRTHHHVRLDRDDDFARMARAANHRLVGLTLGGGFALGIAHVGVIRAMRELNVPIDCVGGTSMGAVIAAECALGFAYEPMLDVIVNGCAASLKGDYTLPVVAFLSGAKLGRTLGKYLEHLCVEDFWLPYFSISASLRYASMRVHDRGDALRSVLASCRAPGMFPPLPWGDDLLVDGGLVNNIPADVMRGFVPGGTVFAVDVSPSEEVAAGVGESLAVSGWGRARSRWTAKKKTLEPEMSLIDVLGRIIRFGGVNRAQGTRAEADCYLVPPLRDFKALDFARGREIADAAYHAAIEDVGAWIAEHGRPWTQA